MPIRAATADDFESIIEIYKYYVRTSVATLEESEPDGTSMRDDLAAILSSGEPFIVANDDSESGQIHGYAYAGPFNSRSGYKHTKETSIYLHPDSCGKGLGKELLRELFTQLKSTATALQVIAKMSILPEQTEEDLPSCRLHTKFGFRTVGRLEKVGGKFDKWVDVVIMQTDLDQVVL